MQHVFEKVFQEVFRATTTMQYHKYKNTDSGELVGARNPLIMASGEQRKGGRTCAKKEAAKGNVQCLTAL